MRYRLLLATAAGLATLTAGAGIAAAQSDDDTTPTTEATTESTTDSTTDSSTDSSTDVTEPADDGTVPSDSRPQPRDRPAGGEGCGDDAAAGTTDSSTTDTGDSTS